MDILLNLEIINKISEIIEQNGVIFDRFEEIYIFGSILRNDTYPNDVDILLIYTDLEIGLLKHIERVQLIIEQEIKLPVDFTVLSTIEKKETQFMERIKGKYIRVI